MKFGKFMSRLAKKPINIPAEVKASQEGESWVFKGPKGELKKTFSDKIFIKMENNALLLSLAGENKTNKAVLGTVAALIKSAIFGVKNGYEKKLEMEGVGYKVQLDGTNLILSLGFTHKVIVGAPKNISFKVEKNAIYISGADKELVGQVAAEIRGKKLPEPYKGKGIHYFGEVIRRKAGKKAVSTA